MIDYSIDVRMLKKTGQNGTFLTQCFKLLIYMYIIISKFAMLGGFLRPQISRSAYSAQSSLSIFAQNYLRKCQNAYFILQNKYLSLHLQR